MNTLWIILLSSSMGLGLLISLAVALNITLRPIQKIYFFIGLLSILIILLDYVFFLTHPPQVIISFPSTPFFFAFAPAVFLFIHYTTHIKQRLSWKHLVHFVPTIALMINATNSGLLLFSQQERFSGEPFIVINPYLTMALHTLQIGIYAYLSLKATQSHRFHSSAITYLKLTAYCLFFLMIINGLTLAGFLILPQFAVHIEYFLTLGFALCVYSLAWPFLTLPAITPPLEREDSLDALRNHQEIYDQFIQLLIEQKLYKDPLLRQEYVAKLLGINRQQLSAVVNTVSHSNFNDVINKYRVKHIEALINEKPNIKILSCAYDSGFNSKATFNRAFKKEKGMSPSEYIKALNSLK